VNVLEARGIRKSFRRHQVLAGVDLAVAAGEMVAVVGENGSGKSTLLACLAGLDEPDGGHVSVLGQRLTRRPEPERAARRAAHIGILLQSGNLLDHLKATVELALKREDLGPGFRAWLSEFKY